MASEIHNDSFTERQLVTFLLGNDEFGADIMDVKEIIRVPDITKVPNAPSYVEGACNLRGNVLPIINGRSCFNLDRKDNDENSRVLVIDVEGKAIGVIVDKVSEVMRVRTSEIEETPYIVRNVNSDYLDGVVKLENGSRLIMLLDIVKALKHNNAGKESFLKDEHTRSFNSSVSSGSVEAAKEEQLVTFLLDKEEYAIDIMQVKEIIRVPQMVEVPNCQDYIDGVVSIRNNLLPMINLRAYFGMERLEYNDQMRILVVDMGTFSAGVIVDKVSEVLRVPVNSIQPPPKFSAETGDQLKGVAKLSKGKRMILLLDPSKLISADEISSLGNIQEADETSKNDDEISMQVLDEEKIVIFKLGTEEYGIKIDNVQEINRMTSITKIPRAPHHIEGIVNLRGNVIPALDLRKLFTLEEKQVTDSTRIIIVDVNDKRTGIIVDSVTEVINLEKRLIEPTPDILSSGIDSDYIEGVAKLNKRMIMILDLCKILD